MSGKCSLPLPQLTNTDTNVNKFITLYASLMMSSDENSPVPLTQLVQTHNMNSQQYWDQRMTFIRPLHVFLLLLTALTHRCLLSTHITLVWRNLNTHTVTHTCKDTVSWSAAAPPPPKSSVPGSREFITAVILTEETWTPINQSIKLSVTDHQ